MRKIVKNQKLVKTRQAGVSVVLSLVDRRRAAGVSMVCRWCVAGVSLVCRWCVAGVSLVCRWRACQGIMNRPPLYF